MGVVMAKQHHKDWRLTCNTKNSSSLYRLLYSRSQPWLLRLLQQQYKVAQPNSLSQRAADALVRHTLCALPASLLSLQRCFYLAPPPLPVSEPVYYSSLIVCFARSRQAFAFLSKSGFPPFFPFLRLLFSFFPLHTLLERLRDTCDVCEDFKLGKGGTEDTMNTNP